MSKKVIIEGMGSVTLSDNEFLSSGGQADIFVKDNVAYKIYHDIKKAIPKRKIQELSSIKSRNVLIPDSIIYDLQNKPIGYTMEFKKNTYPLCKLFTKSFKNSNNISTDMILDLIDVMAKTIKKIHDAKCLVVDMNELNILVSSKFKTPYFIDVDSYQTPSFKADAIMESIRDRSVKNQKWAESSDWYSFAILSFSMLINIHPYKGGHPDYGNSDWAKRMEDGVSIFDPKSSLPKACNDLSVIPPNLMAWFKDLFVKNKRYAPPSSRDNNIFPISISPAISFVSHIINDAFELSMVAELPSNIKSVFNFMGVNYFHTTDGLYKEKNKLPIDLPNADKILFCESGDINPIIASLEDDMATFIHINGDIIGNVKTNDIMYRDGSIYSFFGGQLIENYFSKMGKKVVHMTRYAGNVLNNSTNLFKGVIIQNILGKIHVMLPYEKGKLCSLHVKELDGHRIIEAAALGNICIIMAEQNGVYSRIYLTFNKEYNSYSLRKSHNIPYSTINFSLMDSGVGVIGLDNFVEIFKDSNVRIIEHPPFGSDNLLFNISGGLHYIDQNKLFSVKLKNK